MTDGLDLAKPAILAPYSQPPPDQVQLDRLAWKRDTAATALLVAAAAAVGIMLIALVAAVLPKGRRRHWRAGRAIEVPIRPTTVDPPDQVFLLTDRLSAASAARQRPPMLDHRR